MTPVKSSHLAAVGYNPITRTLTIAFLDGSVYAYFRVPYAAYHGLMKATSHGIYFHAHIERSYVCRKIAHEKAA